MVMETQSNDMNDVKRDKKVADILEANLKIDRYYEPKEDCGKCIICKGFLNTIFGNSPHPLRKHGKCCDKCNHNKVIPARMVGMENLLGSFEEQILQSKVMNILGDEEMWFYDYDEFNKIKQEWRSMVIARGLYPVIKDPNTKSISYTSIVEDMEKRFDAENFKNSKP